MLESSVARCARRISEESCTRYSSETGWGHNSPPQALPGKASTVGFWSQRSPPSREQNAQDEANSPENSHRPENRTALEAERVGAEQRPDVNDDEHAPPATVDTAGDKSPASAQSSFSRNPPNKRPADKQSTKKQEPPPKLRRREFRERLLPPDDDAANPRPAGDEEDDLLADTPAVVAPPAAARAGLQYRPESPTGSPDDAGVRHEVSAVPHRVSSSSLGHPFPSAKRALSRKEADRKTGNLRRDIVRAYHGFPKELEGMMAEILLLFPSLYNYLKTFKNPGDFVLEWKRQARDFQWGQ